MRILPTILAQVRLSKLGFGGINILKVLQVTIRYSINLQSRKNSQILAIRKNADKRLIEVKSEYTIKKAREKLQAAYNWGLDRDIPFEVWLYLGKNKDLHRLTSPDQWESFL